MSITYSFIISITHKSLAKSNHLFLRLKQRLTVDEFIGIAKVIKPHL
jgi:hypothetical protein